MKLTRKELSRLIESFLGNISERQMRSIPEGFPRPTYKEIVEILKDKGYANYHATGFKVQVERNSPHVGKTGMLLVGYRSNDKIRGKYQMPGIHNYLDDDIHGLPDGFQATPLQSTQNALFTVMKNELAALYPKHVNPTTKKHDIFMVGLYDVDTLDDDDRESYKARRKEYRRLPRTDDPEIAKKRRDKLDMRKDATGLVRSDIPSLGNFDPWFSIFQLRRWIEDTIPYAFKNEYDKSGEARKMTDIIPKDDAPNGTVFDYMAKRWGEIPAIYQRYRELATREAGGETPGRKLSAEEVEELEQLRKYRLPSIQEGIEELQKLAATKYVMIVPHTSPDKDSED